MSISRKGFGQVEPNHLSGIVEGKIYAQLPVDTTKMGTIIENGRFAKYDYAGQSRSDKKGVVTIEDAATAALATPWMLIYNEEKLYDERKQSHKDFALNTTDSFDGSIYPRLFSIEVGDIFTTNMFGKANTASDVTVDSGVTLALGDTVKVNKDGYLVKSTDSNAASDSPEFLVVKVYTMADSQDGIKLQCVKA